MSRDPLLLNAPRRTASGFRLFSVLIMGPVLVKWIIIGERNRAVVPAPMYMAVRQRPAPRDAMGVCSAGCSCSCTCMMCTFFRYPEIHSGEVAALGMAFVSFNAPFIRAVSRPAVSPRGNARNVCVPRMGIRAVESYDGSFTLSEEVESMLNNLLLGKSTFCPSLLFCI